MVTVKEVSERLDLLEPRLDQLYQLTTDVHELREGMGAMSTSLHELKEGMSAIQEGMRVIQRTIGRLDVEPPRVVEPDIPDLVCQLYNVQGMVDALSSVKRKRHQDAVLELSEHGIILIVQQSGGLQAKVYLKRELFVSYEYSAKGHSRFGVSLCRFVDCLNTFSVPGHARTIEIRYPDPAKQLLLKLVDSLNGCINAEIRTKIPNTISWDCNFEVAASFIVKFAALKEAIDDLERPCSIVQIVIQPDPPCVTFRGKGDCDLQIQFMNNANTDLLTEFKCEHQICYRYKYNYLSATTSNIPSSIIKDSKESKLTIGRCGMLKVEHLVSIARPSNIEFFVKPKEDVDHALSKKRKM